MKTVYFIGIKGVGMTALAQVYHSRGYRVLGSDVETYFHTQQVLDEHEIFYYQEFSSQNLPQEVDQVIVSSAYYSAAGLSDNVEVQECQRQGIPLQTYSQALGEVSRDFYTLAVTGSHGKTTTSAWLGYALQELGNNPYVLVGSQVPDFGGNARIGNNRSVYCVLEADDYQNHFLDLAPQAEIILNIDYDHPDFFPNEQTYISSYIDFIHLLPEKRLVILCGDDPIIKDHILTNHELYSKYQLITYGYQKHNIMQLMDDNTIWHEQEKLGSLHSALLGKHNRLNALAVVSMVYWLGYEMEDVLPALESFQGTKRRLEYYGQHSSGAQVFDDYAHHPQEIQATLSALREKYPHQRLVCLFQPHTFSRTKTFLEQFAQSFSQADKVYLAPIYGSAREEQGTVSIQDLATAMKKFHSSVEVYSLDQPTDTIFSTFTKDTIFITLGAGNVWTVAQKSINT